VREPVNSNGSYCVGQGFKNRFLTDGFHNIRYRIQQWDEMLEKNPKGRKELLKQEIVWIENRRDEM